MVDPVRVLIVDDSAFVRRAVERMLADAPSARIVGSAANGKDAVALTRQLRPDVVILDINMPEMDGLEALGRIMDECPTAVLMLSTLTQEGAEATIRALELGAVDFMDKTSAGTMIDIYGLAPLLQEKVLAAAGASVSPSTSSEQGNAPAPEGAQSDVRLPPRSSPYEVVVIGTSTGGPRALVEVLSSLPADFGASVVVAQHMPTGFTRTLAERLDRRCPLRVVEAQDGDPVLPGRILIAPGGHHISLKREERALVVRVTEGPDHLLHHPSVDLLFTSTAQAVGSRAIGVVLTGMGDDGAHGLDLLRQAGARTLVESEQTAVIYGMPRSARPFAEHVLTLPKIGPALIELCAGRHTPPGSDR